MEIIQKNLSTASYQTKAVLTGYLQTPVPKSPVQQFRPLIFVPGGSRIFQSNKPRRLRSVFQLAAFRFSCCAIPSPASISRFIQIH